MSSETKREGGDPAAAGRDTASLGRSASGEQVVAPEGGVLAQVEKLTATETAASAVTTLRVGMGLIAGFQVADLAICHVNGRPGDCPLGWHLFSLLIPLAIVSLSWRSWFLRWWRAASMAGCAAVIAGAMAVALVTQRGDEFGFWLLVVLVGTGLTLPWEWSWQAALALLSLAAVAVVDGSGASFELGAGLRWLVFLAAVAGGLVSTELRARQRHKADSALKELGEQESLLRAVLDSSIDVITVHALADGRYIDLNRKKGAAGYSRLELIGRAPGELALWPEKDRVEQFLGRLQAGETIHNFELTVRKKDGTEVPCLISAMPTVLDGRRCFVAVTRNITEFKRAAEANALWASVWDTSADSLTTWSRDFLCTGWNRAAQELYGYRPEEALGRHVLFLAPPQRHPELREIMARLQRGEIIKGLETERVRKDGRPLDIALTFWPVRDQAGTLLGYSATARDITQRKRVERERADNEAKFKAVFNLSPDPVSINRLDDGRYLEVSEGWLKTWGFSASEVLGHRPAEIKIWEKIDDLRAIDRMLRESGRVINYEAGFRRRGGQRFTGLFSAVVAELGGCKVILSYVRDISERKEAEQTNALWSSVWESSVDQMGIWTPDFVCSGWNPAGEKLFGYSRAEIVGKHLSTLVPPDRQQEMDRIMAALRRGETIQALETRRVRKDGTLFDVSLSFWPVRDRGGKLLGYSAVARDISELKAAERKIQESEAGFRALFEMSPDPMAIARFDDKVCVEVNPAFTEQLGYTRQEILGRSGADAGLWADLEERAAFYMEMERNGFVRNFELLLRHRSGRAIPMLVSSFRAPWQGQPCQVWIAREISELKRIQAALRESEEKFRRVYDSSLDAIVLTDLETGVILDVNQEFARRTGISRERAVGRTREQAGMWARPEELKRFARLLQTTGEVRNFEGLFKDAGGNERPRLLNTAIVNLGGRKTAVTVSRDISHIKEVERALVAAREAALAASKAKSEFLSSMSHEIRTPMNAILGMGDVLAETPLNSEQQRYLEVIRSNATTLLGLINDILDLARIESGQLELARAAFALDQLVEQTATDLALSAHQKGIELIVRIRPGTPLWLIGDALHLRQILINLLANAIKFTARGEVVLSVESAEAELSAASPQSKGEAESAEPAAARPAQPKPATGPWSRIIFSVADTGIGIPRDKLGTIFGAFVQADSSTTRRFGGSGLGLAIVKRLVELAGGEISVESEPGIGSTFRVTLPLQKAEGDAVTAPPEPLDLSGCRMLVVDDTAANRMVVRELLAPTGARLEEADGAQSAMAKLNAAARSGDPYRFLLVDFRMPQVDGLQLARQIRELRAGDSPRGGPTILMLTSDGLGSQLKCLNEAGIDAYLIKPIRRSELFSVIAGLLKASPAPAAGVVSEPKQGEPPGLSKQPLRLLLAEDSSDNRAVIAAYLKTYPYTLDYACDGEQAVRSFTTAAPGTHRYDLVLMDIQMPIMDGCTAVSLIRQWEHEHGLPATPIVALTASALEDDVKKCLEAGCTSHLAKPVTRASLLGAIALATAGQPSGAAKSAAAALGGTQPPGRS